MSDEKRQPKTPSAKGEGFVMEEKAETAHSADGVDFATFIFSLATGAFIQMGLAPDPMTGKTEKNLPMARQTIDMLLMLKDKTRGNLTSDEKELIERLVNDAQLGFVKASKK